MNGDACTPLFDVSPAIATRTMELCDITHPPATVK